MTEENVSLKPQKQQFKQVLKVPIKGLETFNKLIFYLTAVAQISLIMLKLQKSFLEQFMAQISVPSIRRY